MEDWKNKTLIKMDTFKSLLNNKIRGLNCIIEMMIMNNNDNNKELDPIIKEIEDIIDTIYVDITHIDNFNSFINDINIPISSIIKRKNKLLSNTIYIQKNIINKLSNIDGALLAHIEFIIDNIENIHCLDIDIIRRASYKGQTDVVKCLIKHGAEGLRHSWRCSRYSLGG
jgi:hypothetical protein